MKIFIGLILLFIGYNMRLWGRVNYYKPEVFKPLYQTNVFWLFFSLTGISFFVGGLCLLISGLMRVL